MKKIKEQRDVAQAERGRGLTPAGTELSDDELDSAAGGIRQPEAPKDPNLPDGGN